jgi:hypothetical protein
LTCAFLALSVPAVAQQTPASPASPPPTPSRAPARSAVSARRADYHHVSHLPIIDIVPTFTQPGPFATPGQMKGYVPFDVGGTITIPITDKLSASFDRTVEGAFNGVPERYITPTGAVYPLNYRDVQLTERVDYQLDHLVLEAGYSFRHREDGTGVSTGVYPYTISSTEAHFGYLSAIYTTPPIRALGGARFIAGIAAQEQPVDHHVAVLNPTTRLVNYIDESPNQNRYWESQQQVGVVIPIDPKHGFTFTARDIWGGANFYENQPGPWRWNGDIVLQATKKFTNYFSLSMRLQDQHYAIQGFPFPAPNANHVETIDVLGDFHVDLNRLIHL